MMRATLICLFFFLFATSQAAVLPLKDFKYAKTCIGDFTVFTDLSCCNIDTWEWDFGDPASGASNKAYTQVANHKFTSAGTYTVTLKIGSFGSFVDTITKLVVICIPEKPVLLFHDTTICNGNKIFLYPLNTFSRYYWNTGDTTRTIVIIDPGKYILCTTNCDSSCLVCDTARVTVLNAPITQLGKYTATCNRDSFQLNARNTGFKYLWNTGDSTQKIWAKKDGWYSVKIYNLKCFVIDSTYLTFAKRLSIGFNTDTIACEGDTLLLNPGWIYNQILWNYTDTNHVLKVYIGGLYPLRIYYQGCVIDTYASVNFTTRFPLKLPNDTAICSGDTLYVSSGVNATKFHWSNGDTTKSTKIYKGDTLWLRVSFNGCYQTDTMIIKIKKKPELSPISKVYTCSGLPGTLTVGAAPENNFQWCDGNSNKTRAFSDTGWHCYTIYNSCYTVTDSAYTGYYPLFIGDSVTILNICYDDDTVVYLTAKKAGSYLWKPGDFTTPSISPKKYGRYSVEITDSGGCKEIDSFNIVKKCIPDTLLIPNAFSPNGDGKNDVYKPSYVRHVNYDFRIYDRWGELMFHTNDINEGWDGKYQSMPVAEDVYIYLIEVSGYNVFRQIKGTVHLIR